MSRGKLQLLKAIAERAAMIAGVLPDPFFDSHLAAVRAHAIMTAVEAGLLEALAPGPASAATVAAKAGGHERAVALVLDALVGARYLDYDPKSRHYALAGVTRRWLLADSPTSVREKVLFQRYEIGYLARLTHFVRTGESCEIHASDDGEFWRSYQGAMLQIGHFLAQEVAERAPVPAGATRMLDIGGAVGYFSAAICLRHPGLRATVLDLPPAVEKSKAMLPAVEGADRVEHLAGNVLADDLGEGRFDFILFSGLAHHFTEEENRLVVRKAARALRPGGHLALQDFFQPEAPGRSPVDAARALLGLQFGIMSRSGCWRAEQARAWLIDAGLQHPASVTLRSVPGAMMLSGERSA